MEDFHKPIEIMAIKEYREIKVFPQFDMGINAEFCVRLSDITAFYKGEHGTNIWLRGVGHLRTKEKYSDFKEWMNV